MKYLGKIPKAYGVQSLVLMLQRNIDRFLENLLFLIRINCCTCHVIVNFGIAFIEILHLRKYS